MTRASRSVCGPASGLACGVLAALAAGPPAATASAPAVAPAVVDAPAAAAPVEDEVRGMLEAMSRAEADARAMLQRLDDVMARGPAQFAGTAEERARGSEDWRWTLLQRVNARLRALLDPEALAAQREAARIKLEEGDAAGARQRVVDYMQPYLARAEEVSTKKMGSLTAGMPLPPGMKFPF